MYAKSNTTAKVACTLFNKFIPGQNMSKVTKIVMPIPHGSNNLTEKNHNEILHLVCMPHDIDKLWHIIKKMTYKNLNIVKKTS